MEKRILREIADVRTLKTLARKKTAGKIARTREPFVIKSQLVLRIAAQNPRLYHRDVEKVVNAILDQIVSAMARRGRVDLRGFGTFGVKVWLARVAATRKPEPQ
jgi:nucleoid DNA-binding protein